TLVLAGLPSAHVQIAESGFIQEGGSKRVCMSESQVLRTRCHHAPKAWNERLIELACAERLCVVHRVRSKSAIQRVIRRETMIDASGELVHSIPLFVHREEVLYRTRSRRDRDPGEESHGNRIDTTRRNPVASKRCAGARGRARQRIANR